MKKPADMTSTPRGDWCYRQPETDMPFRAQHPKVLEEEVFAHRMSLPDLNLDVTGNWRERLWSDVCSQNEFLNCHDTEDSGKYPTLADVVNWVRSMANWTAGGFQVVPQETAEARAAICVKCPNNQQISGCLGCRGAGEIISSLTGGRTTSLDNNLFNCRACSGCALTAKVHLPLEVISTAGLDLPSFCWLRSP